MSPTCVFWSKVTSHRFFWKHFLAAFLGLVASMDLHAQVPTESELLRITSPKPNSVKKFELKELLTVSVRYKNNTENTVILSAMPYTNGFPTPKYGYRPETAGGRDRGTVNLSFTCNSPAVVDEIRVKMADRVTKQEIAVIGLPVQMTWGDDLPAPPPAPVPNPTPAPVPEPAASLPPGTMRMTVEVYEIPVSSYSSLKKVFANGTPTERDDLLKKLRQKKPLPGIVPLAAFEGAVIPGQKRGTDFSSTSSKHRYPVSTAGHFQERQLGWSAYVNIMLPTTETASEYETDISLYHTQFLETHRYWRSADGNSSFVQPFFASESLDLKCRLAAGKPKLAGILPSPYQEKQAMKSLRAVLITILETK